MFFSVRESPRSLTRIFEQIAHANLICHVGTAPNDVLTVPAVIIYHMYLPRYSSKNKLKKKRHYPR